MKTCIKCGFPKSLDEYYIHTGMADGHLNECKGCVKSRVKHHNTTNRKERSEYERNRRQRPERKKAQIEHLRQHRIRNPNKAKARAAVSNAIRDGKLVKQPCEVCGRKAQAHHDDYSRPLDVKWLCFKCHREQSHGQVVVCDEKFFM
jgi:hypothetical protein